MTMTMPKAKILNAETTEELQRKINDFIFDKNVIDVSTYYSPAPRLKHHCCIIYEGKE